MNIKTLAILMVAAVATAVAEPSTQRKLNA
jgi:hypothetical protein